MNLITRKEARQRGLSRYFTGKVCPHGHITERYVTGKACVGCRRDKRRRQHWRANPVAVRQRSRRAAAKRKGYAPPPNEHACPSRPSDGQCECCKRISANPLCLDHDHATGEFRGWLCRSCNTAIGAFKEDVSTMRLGVAYMLARGRRMAEAA